MNVRPEELAKTREREQWDAARVLGVREVVFMRYPDQGLEDTPQFRKAIVREIRRYRPHTVITSDPYRRYIWHRDHRIVGQVVLDAVYPYARDHLAYPDLIEEGLQPHKVKELLFWGAETPITGLILQQHSNKSSRPCYAMKVRSREMTIPDLEGWLKDRAREMAAGEDYELGETFHRVEIPL